MFDANTRKEGKQGHKVKRGEGEKEERA